MSTLPPVESAYREKPLETIVHVGYDVILSENVLQAISDLFPPGLAPESLHAGPYNTAVKHIGTGVTQADLHNWFKKANKNVNDVTRVRSIYHRLLVSYDKENKPKKCQGLVVLYVTVGGNHLYVNVYNDQHIPPFTVKKMIGSMTEQRLDAALTVSAVAYKH